LRSLRVDPMAALRAVLARNTAARAAVRALFTSV
jgi:hypothetical protein